MALQLALGCTSGVHRSCCGNECTSCADLFAVYGYTELAVSGVAGSMTLYYGPAAPPPPTPETWPGFSSSSITIPLPSGPPCDDSLEQDAYMLGDVSPIYYFNFSDPVKFYSQSSGGGIGANLQASVTYACTDGVASRSIGFQIGYVVTGDVAAQYSESSFTDWTWANDGVFGGRMATKTLSGGVIATWRRSPLSGGRTRISISVGHTETDLEAGNPPVTSITIPTVPYDYLGILIGTATLS